MKRTLIIKSDRDAFERYYNDALRAEGCVVKAAAEYKPENENVYSWKAFRRFLSIKRKSLEQYDLIVVFEAASLVPFLWLKAAPGTKIVLWCWNLMGDRHAHKMKAISPFCEIWTFDRGQAQKYGWKLNDQFYCPMDVPTQQSPKRECRKAFCACVDKGRYEELKEIRDELNKRNIECDFTLVKEKNKQYDPQDDWVKDEGIPYPEFLQRTLDSDILVDLVQKNQVGITVRVLEALFYNKKLITNNPDVKNYPFYDERNIFVWNTNERSGFDTFMKSRYCEVSDEIRKKYTVLKWLNRFRYGKERL